MLGSARYWTYIHLVVLTNVSEQQRSLASSSNTKKSQKQNDCEATELKNK